METGEKLEISNAVKLPFRVSSRDVYQFSYTDEYSHIVLQDRDAVDTFPIILVGEWWTQEEKTPTNLAILSRHFIWNQRNTIFIVRIGKNLFRTYEYTKKDIKDIPLVATEPVHSTAVLLWNRSEDEILSPEVPALLWRARQLVAKL
jgi:hypothetical protein